MGRNKPTSFHEYCARSTLMRSLWESPKGTYAGKYIVTTPKKYSRKVAVRNILIYCEIEHKGRTYKDLAKSYEMLFNTVYTIHKTLKQKIDQWRKEE